MEIPPNTLTRPEQPKLSDRVTTGIAALFGLPFAAFGTAGFIAGIKKLAAGDTRGGLPLMLISPIFAFVGFGLWYGLYRASKAKKRTDAISAAHPDEPWLVNDQWAGGSIKSSTRSTMVTACLFAGLWNLVSSAAIGANFRTILNERKPAALLILLFPAGGIGLLIWAVRAIIRWKKFGESIFKMQSVPGVIGGSLSGAIRTSVKLQPEDGFHIKLRCVNLITTQSGENSSTTEHILWEDEKTLVKDLLADDPRRSGIPVFFQIPRGSRPSDNSNSRNRIVWRLEARAKVPGIGYFAQFEVPVFVVAGAADAGPVVDPLVAYEPPAKPYQLPANSRIKVRQLPSGETEFVFPAFRNPVTCLTFGFFVAIFSGITWWLTVARAGVFFPIVFGLTSLFIWLAWLNLLFRSSRAVADANGIGVFTHWLFLRTGKRLASSDITTIGTKIGMTSGGTVYYNIFVAPRSGNDITLATAIKDHAEAVWLAAEMQRLLKLDKHAPAPTIGA